jgi:hypothetical protein
MLPIFKAFPEYFIIANLTFLSQRLLPKASRDSENFDRGILYFALSELNYLHLNERSTVVTELYFHGDL